jgi:hypothetical protein
MLPEDLEGHKADRISFECHSDLLIDELIFEEIRNLHSSDIAVGSH